MTLYKCDRSVFRSRRDVNVLFPKYCTEIFGENNMPMIITTFEARNFNTRSKIRSQILVCWLDCFQFKVLAKLET